MAKHFIPVCIFCFICATHSPCESHAEEHGNYKTEIPFLETDTPPVLHPNWEIDNNSNHLLTTQVKGDNVKFNNSVSNKEHGDKYLRKIFEKYGDGKTMTIEGFTKLLNHVDLVTQILHKRGDPALSYSNIAALTSHHETDNLTETNNFTCINHKDIFELISSSNIVDRNTMVEACPSILFSLLGGMCMHNTDTMIAKDDTIQTSQNNISVWFYSFLAVLIISACGILGIAVIPIMQKHYYKPLLQFLVALAIGTLTGDAFLHLLPHAMSTEHSSHHSHEHAEFSNSHDENMWKGFVAMLGLILFFVMERVIVIVVRWRKNQQLKHTLPANMKVMKEGLQVNSVGEKQCKHKYSSVPFCYDTAIAMIDKTHAKEDYPVFRLVGGQDDGHTHDTSSTLLELNPSSELDNLKKIEANQNLTECPSENATNCTDVNKMIDNNDVEEYTIILREHENRHHGHSHTHGHVHAAPKNLSSVAWMVIMGDGLHNFTDGMAIGAAFSTSVAGGFSTAVAVFCHELPHELGDFAMLLKAGMSMKQALFYNILSSILCLFGNTVGVWLGNTEYASSWVFAIAAGTFVYIALVDMVPELSNGHEENGTFFQCILQLSGLLLGFAIMTCIAVYEHDLKHIFHEPV